jgi:ABC-type iron transport system FetAB ATPase subunit
VITGPSGIGKSTIVKMVALQLQRTDDYHILPALKKIINNITCLFENIRIKI